MLAQNTIDSSRRVVKSLLFIVSMVLVLAVPAFAQMSYNSTVYTDCGDHDGYLLCWGYTYAPSGSYIIHTYNAHTKMTLPDGSFTENWGSGSGDTPARANLVLQVTLDTPDGTFNINSDHQARCPAAGIFLATASAL